MPDLNQRLNLRHLLYRCVQRTFPLEARQRDTIFHRGQYSGEQSGPKALCASPLHFLKRPVAITNRYRAISHDSDQSFPKRAEAQLVL